MVTSLIRITLFYCGLQFALATPAGTSSFQDTTFVRRSFEVATVKPNNAINAIPIPPIITSDYVAWTARTLKVLICYAYNVRDWQIEGGSGWVDSQLWDVEARVREKSTPAEPSPFGPNVYNAMRPMMQSLLEDRFKLKIKRQTKESSVYSLVVVKDGPKIHLDEDQSPIPSPQSGTRTSSEQGQGMPRGSLQITPFSIDARAVSIAQFITIILASSDRPIIDNTNLNGLYTFKMKWSPEDSGFKASSGTSSPISKPSRYFGPSFFTALQEQLGLRMESTKAPVDFIFIANVSKPSVN